MDELTERFEEHPASTPRRRPWLADSVGMALLVVLDTLAPTERFAFVLHDMFAVPFDESARRATGRARFSALALVDGRPGLILATRGRFTLALTFELDGDRITEIDIIADPERLAGLELALID